MARSLRAAQWRNEQDLAEFVGAVGQLTANEVAACLAVVAHASSRAEPAAHQMRCWAFANLASRVPDPALFGVYLQAVPTPDAALREILVSLIPTVNNVAQHGELCRLLGHARPDVREISAEIVGRVAVKVTLDMLVKLCLDPSFAGRVEALNAMVPKVRHHAVPLIQAVIAAGRPFERYHALALLADARFIQSGTPGCAEIAASVLGDEDERAVCAALPALARHASEELYHQHARELIWNGTLPVSKAAIESLGAFPTAQTMGILTQRFREGPNPIRIAVTDTAEALANEAGLGVLVEALTAKHVGIRNHAFDAITRLATAGKVDPARAILWLLRSRDTDARRLAVELANRVGDPGGELAPKLLKYLRDEDWWVRERTMDALIEMKWPGLARHLTKYLRDPADVVRRFATGALRRIGDAAALPELLRLASSDPDWWVREDAVHACAATRDPRAVPYLLQLVAAQPALRRVSIDALSTLGDRQAADEIARHTGDPDADVRAAAMSALTLLGNPTHATAVEALLEDEVPRVRKAARDLLVKWQLVEGATTHRGKVALDDILAMMIESDADDLVLLADRQPYIKKRGKMEPLAGFRSIRDDVLRSMLEPYLSPVQLSEFECGKDVDLSATHKGLGARFRVNLFEQSSGVGAVFRVVRNDALLLFLENLGLPPLVAELCKLKDGLVIVGGSTGSGKSTTLSAMVDTINRSSARHILTIEDPIETLHLSDRSLLTQREVGSHTPSFERALRAGMREDPDVILVGEMRDYETMSFAITAAETGHLVLATLHTSSAETSVTRLINSFPAGQQPQVRAMLAGSLRAVLCQNLLRRKGSEGRVVATEIMLNNDAVANLIRKGKEFQISSVLLSGQSGNMRSMDQELARLVREDAVEYDDAYARANDKSAFEILTGRAVAASARPARGSEAQRPGPAASTAPPQPASQLPSSKARS